MLWLAHPATTLVSNPAQDCKNVLLLETEGYHESKEINKLGPS
jgi:hypothetical protein